MKRIVAAAAAVCLSFPAFADEAVRPAAAPAEGKKPKAPVNKSAADLKFVRPEGAPPGVEMAPLKGDPSKGPHQAMAKFPAGPLFPLHSHSASLEMVIISGTWMYGPDAASVKEYGPGSYLSVPGGSKHVSGCKADCFVYQRGDGKMDMTPAEGEAAKK